MQKTIKVSAETHQAAKIWAAQQGIPLGEAVEKLIKLGMLADSIELTSPDRLQQNRRQVLKGGSK